MATVVSSLFISLDGVAEIDPEWHFPYFDEAMGAAVGEDYEDVDVLLLGRVTYDSFAGAWPEREQAGGEDASFAAQLGDTRKLVATRGDADLGWRNVERTADLLASVRALKDDPTVGKVLVGGSLSVVRQLLDARLLDELRLFVHPVAARTGERLFGDADTIQPFTLLRTDVFSRGVVKHVFAPGELPPAATYDDAKEHLPDA
ncbi:dihydrofolate reductase family protein [Cellulomonas sp. S1-8]|uniref:dihydrofolate reductase family protein n=1 Tax=Cellulomonas sp. S1-8 TaxID=2904790 RepID=UPI002244DF72|nr:dihydrofolate reductase family protein [Cellulomonas sp. S1-8]UZN03899.1 dihydrofolate reductase family protein [Cellulomonas sp. S1-8]